MAAKKAVNSSRSAFSVKDKVQSRSKYDKTAVICPLSVRVLALAESYGCDYNFARFYVQMCIRDRRMEKGLSFLEFNYMIMQSYDFYTCLLYTSIHPLCSKAMFVVCGNVHKMHLLLFVRIRF